MKFGPLLIAGGIAGLVMATLSNVPVISYGNCLGCMWLWLSGILGAGIYRYSANSISGGQGAVIGLLSGVVGAIIGAVLGAIFGTIGISSLFSSVLGEDTSALSLFSGGAYGTGFALLALLFNIFLYPLFGAIGGAVGGVIFSKSAPSAQSARITQ